MTGPLAKGARVALVPSGRLGTVDEDAPDGATVKVVWDDGVGPYRCAPLTLAAPGDVRPWDENLDERFVSTAKPVVRKRPAKKKED